MKKLFLIVGCLGMLVFSNAVWAYQFDMGSGSSVDTSGTNNMLIMYANVNPILNNIIFDLDPGQQYSFLFAMIGTTESWINNDDLIPGSLTAYVDFDNPDITQAIGGTSIGFSAGWNFLQGWNLTWSDPVTVNFGNGGSFRIDLSDVSYSSIFWCGPDGSADVYATVTNTSVPEPATMLLLGSGLLGMGLFGRRRFRK